MKRVAALFIAGFCGLAAAEAPPRAADAGALVRAMRLDEIAAGIANDQAQRTAEKRRVARRNQDCINTLRPASLTDDLARAIKEYLSPAEIETAAAFYATSAGDKVVEHTFRQVEHQLAGGMDNPPPPATTPEEDVTFDAFAKTPAGKKFVDNGFLLNISQVESVISAGARDALARCRDAGDPSVRREIVPTQKDEPLANEPQSQ